MEPQDTNLNHDRINPWVASSSFPPRSKEFFIVIPRDLHYKYLIQLLNELHFYNCRHFTKAAFLCAQVS